MLRRMLQGLAIAVFASKCLFGGEPILEKQELFVAETGGYAAYRIPALLVTKKGALLAACEARKTRGDWAAIDILLRRSDDGGRTWSDAQLISRVPGPPRKNPVALKQKLADPDVVTNNNPLLIADTQTGAVHLLFCQEYFRCYYCRSDDDGQTFTEPVEITAAFEPFRKVYDWKVLATGPGHGIQLRNGRLIVPVWLSTGTGGHAHRPSIVTTLFSDDHGASWKCGEIIAGEVDPLVNPSESVAVQLADGRVLMNMRSEAARHLRGVATSADGATEWTKPSFDEELLEPICMASLCRVSEANSTGGKNRIVFSNPHYLEKAKGRAEPGKNRDRKNLSIKLSHDEAESWPISKTLEAGPSGYSDLATGPDGTIYCLYERPGVAPDPAGPSLVFARFNLEWLTDGQDSFTR